MEPKTVNSILNQYAKNIPFAVREKLEKELHEIITTKKTDKPSVDFKFIVWLNGNFYTTRDNVYISFLTRDKFSLKEAHDKYIRGI